MRITTMSIDGHPIGCLRVTKKEMNEAYKCENCGRKAVLNHERLAKETLDWCLKCNYDKFRKEFTGEEFASYCLEQTKAGNAVIIVVE